MRLLPFRMAVAVAGAVVASCSTRPSPGVVDAPLPAPVPMVEIAMRDHAFDYDPDIPAGRVVFRGRNVGQVPHRLTLLPLPDDVPPIDEQLRSPQRRFIEPFAGFADRLPGEVESFAVNLAPGQRYAMICYVVDADGEPHYRKGMSSEFRTAPAAGDSTVTTEPSSTTTAQP